MDAADSPDDAGLPPPWPMPAIAAVLAGCALALLGGILLPYAVARPAPAMLYGGGAAAGLLLWLAAFPLWIRPAPPLWWAAGLLVLLGAGAGGALIADRYYGTGVLRDASSFAEAEIDQEGLPSLPSGAAGRGPLSALHLAQAREATKDRRGQERALAEAGISALNSPYALETSPAVLGNCGGFAALAPMVEVQRREQAARAARMTAAIEASPQAPEVRRGIAMMAVPYDADGAKRLFDAQAALLEASGAVCRVLARRTWRNYYGEFNFASAADSAAHRAAEARRYAAVGAITAAQRASRERVTQGRDLVREALAR